MVWMLLFNGVIPEKLFGSSLKIKGYQTYIALPYTRNFSSVYTPENWEINYTQKSAKDIHSNIINDSKMCKQFKYPSVGEWVTRTW